MKKAFFITILTLIAILGFNYKASASTGDNIFGNAWSFNIGWISFNNCANPTDSSSCGSIDYGVDYNSNNISGYAWNDNVGWISFNPSDWGGCPPSGSTSCNSSNYSSFNNKLDIGGWGRVLSAKGNSSSDWDGWISIAGNGSNGWGVSVSTSNVASSMGSMFSGVSANVKSLTGFMWGSEVLGWIDMGPNPSLGANDVKYGGVYYLASYTSGSLSLTPSAKSIISGDTVDIDWSVTGFTPTSCTGSGTGTYSDWAKTTTVSSATGKFSGIHVPNDTTTEFVLTCTNGTAQTSGKVSIEAKTLTATLTNYTNACFASGTKPSFSWTTNDPSPSCTVTASHADGSTRTSATFNTTGTSPGVVQDTNFDDKNSYYSMTCTNGTGSYKSTVTTPSNGAYATMCTPNYTLSANTSCQGGYGALVSKVAGSSPTRYEGKTSITLTPNNGFTSNASVSSNSGTGTVTISPSSGFSYSNSTYNTVDVKLSLTQTQYSNLVSNMTNNILRTLNLTVKGSSQNTNSKTFKLNYCDSTATPGAGTLTLTPNKTSVTSGDTVNFSWSLSGFTPTSCTGSGAGNSDWDKTTTVSSTSGSFNGINVPVNGTTRYKLTCTNGQSTAVQEADVSATPLAASISYTGSCVNNGGTKPTLTWTTNDSTPNCTINANPTDGTAGHSFSAGSSGSTQDTGYGYKDTKYYLSCTNGSGAYKVTTVSSNPPTVQLCVPDYTVSGSSSCQGGIGGVFSAIAGSKYKADVDLTLNPLNGFTSNATVSGSSGLGTLAISPSSFTRTNSVYNTVNAALTITNAEYAALNILKKIVLTVTGSAQNTTAKSVNVNFCKTEGGTLTLTPNKTSVTSGDTVNFSWSLSGFTPTSCTGSGAGNSDWDKTTTVSSTSGSFSNIKVPLDTTTQYSLSCTDGTDTATAFANVKANPLTASVWYAGSCVNSGSNPGISWSTNDSTPNCTITATPASGGSHTISIGSSSSSPKTDTGYTDESTTYSMSCTNGSGSYQATASAQMAGSVGICNPGTTTPTIIKPRYKAF